MTANSNTKNESETNPGGGLTYAATGVDIEAGDEAARRLMGHMRRTHGPRVIANPGGFAGLFRLDYNEQLFKRNYKDPVLVACADGVGSKVLLAQKLGVHDTVGIDLVAMNVNDLIVQGAEPLLFLDYIGVHAVDPAAIERLVAGVAEGCERAGCALLGGETAELPAIYAAGEYDLAGFSVGVVELKRATDPTRVEPGDVILGLASDGVHSNGFSLVRGIIEHAGLDLDRGYPSLDPDRTLGEVLLTPTRIYAQPIVKMLREYKVKKVVSGMAHITGGGLSGNLVRALHDKVDAVIDASAWAVPPVFEFLQEQGKVEDAEMERVFNMGIGYCLIVRPTFAEGVAEKLRKSGETVFAIGEVVKGSGTVTYR
ncbi:MAG: phosphoribosylformylglycinamidine cyclo-ligase [Planctomycetota bacterium]